MPDTKVRDGDGGGKVSPLEGWRIAADNAADRMAAHLAEAMQPLTAIERAQKLILANGWRLDYQLARRKMEDQS